MKIIIIFHRVDGDGLASCMIARDHYRESTSNIIDFFGYNYGDKMPDLDNYLKVYDEICMVDISFDAEDMKKLYSSGKLVWIDHHITAIEDSEKFGYSEAQGVRLIGKAACELSWGFFYKGKKMPKFVYYIGVYDTWRKEELDWENEILPLQYTCRTDYGVKLDNWTKNWASMKKDSLVEGFVEKGRGILKFLKQTWESWVKNFGFNVTVDGKYRAICMITPMFGSSCFESVLNKYDLFITVNRKEDERGVYYSLSMYKEPDHISEFSCGKYLKEKFNTGGGHDSAAGTRISQADFIKLLETLEL